MSIDPIENPYDHPSLAKRIAAPILAGLHAVLPERLYNALYFPAFALYKRSLRAAYRRQMQRARRSGDHARAVCMERVYGVMEYSLVGTAGLEHTHRLATGLALRNVPGAFVECGVAQGGCAALIAQVAAAEGAGRACWFFDSFEGLPDPTELDYAEGKTGRHVRPLVRGSCLGTIEQVSWLLFDHFHLSRERITLVKGWFQDTLPVTKAQIGPIALLRVDGDWYESTRCCLDQLYDQISPGGQIIIDDYCSCFGARKATDEFIATHGIATRLVPDGRGGASFEKPRPSAAARAA